ncbi:MAG TPA: insulinase family protein, partial [Kofleriaceae bacterium]|nr:insulinase family protein [Kofleriaceae bacterium]
RGVLANGLTYYVMPYHQPEDRAALWLAVNAGSLQEDDDQQGLAHLVEHMAFNGTKRFPKMAIVDYLESIGMSFGPHVNAYTSFDETVYQLMVPTDKPEFVDKGLDILRDWAGDLSFDPDEVAKERGVVLEEWRLGRGPWARIFDKQAATLYRGTRYARRLTIGKPEIIKGATREQLLRYYHDWYRPDLMAVIVVGDIDPAKIEQQITAKFGDLVEPAHPRPRITAEPLTADGTKVSIETDPELPQTQLAIHNVFPHRRESTEGDFRQFVLDGLYHTMLNERLAQLGRAPDAPFVYAFSSTGDLTRQYEAFSRSAVAKEGQLEPTLAALFGEVLRVERHGFTAGELERAKKTELRGAEQSASEADKEDATDYTRELTRNFFEHELVIGREAEAKLWEKLLPTVTLDEVNRLAQTWGGADNRVITISGPASATMPTKERVLAIIDEVKARDLPAWEDNPPSSDLMTAKPTPGRIVAEKTYPELGVTEWKLSNGARVVLKPTDFENQRVHVAAVSPGGLALVPDKQFKTGREAIAAVSVGGLGSLSATDLGKALAGTSARGAFWLGENEEGVSGSGASDELETMAQLLYLGFTAPRKDPLAFTAWRLGQKTFLAHRDVVPETVFSDAMTDVMTKGNPRRKPVVAADLDDVDLDEALAIYRQRFGDVSDFTFVVVGSFDPAKLRPLVETYLASLPGKGRKDPWKDVGVRRPKGVVEKVVHAGTEPKAAVTITFHGDDRWSRDGERDAFVLAAVLRIRLREILREDMSGVYGVSVGGGVSRKPRQERSFTIRFGCAPANVDALKQAVFAEIARVQKEGVSDEYLEKVKETMRRGWETAQRDNDWWEEKLEDAYLFGDDPRQILDLEQSLARVTAGHVQAAARHFLDPKQYVLGVLLPVDGTPPEPAAVTAPAPAPATP